MTCVCVCPSVHVPWPLSIGRPSSLRVWEAQLYRNDKWTFGLRSIEDVFWNVTYLLCCYHSYHIHPFFPHHLPEIMTCCGQRSLCGYVLPFFPTNMNLEKMVKKKTATKLNLCISTLPYTSTFPDKSTPYPYCQVFGSNLAGRNNSVTHPCNSTLMIAFWGIVRRYLSFWKVHSIFANMEKLENLLKSVRILLFQRFKISVLGAEKGKRGIGEGGRRLGDGVHTKN